MSALLLDATRSRVWIHTFAEGVLARLAHDIEIVCGGLSGSASLTADGGSPKGSAMLEAPLRGMSVRGVLGKDGHVDERALSPAERRDILAKMHGEVFHVGHAGPDAIVRVEAHLEGGAVHMRIVPPNGTAAETVVRPEVRAEADGVRASGSFEVSLAAIGSNTVKGPMGAFRVKDRVRVSFDAAFTPAGDG